MSHMSQPLYFKLLPLSSPLPAHTPSYPSSLLLSCIASLFLSTSTPLLHLPVSCFSNPHVCVCPSAFLHVCFLSCRVSTPLIRGHLCGHLAPLSLLGALSLCNICLDWHPVSEPLRVLSASSCVKMDV